MLVTIKNSRKVERIEKKVLKYAKYNRKTSDSKKWQEKVRNKKGAKKVGV